MTRDPRRDPAQRRPPLDDATEQLMVRVARMAYLEDRTHTEIASLTGLNRWRVSRLLEEAREAGLVRIEIVSRGQRRADLEASLIGRYGLADAWVVRAGADEALTLDLVAQAAGQYLARLSPPAAVLGVSWGRTMSAVAYWMPANWAEAPEVVQINGTVAVNPGAERTADVAETLARKAGGRAVPLPVPAILGAAETRAVLERDRIVARVLDRARAADTLCFSVGALDPRSVLVTSGNIEAADFRRLQEAGAVGDVLGRFVTATGAIADAGIDARALGLPLDHLRGHRRAIAVAAGPGKQAVVRAALRAGLMTVLVTDERTAEHALERADDP